MMTIVLDGLNGSLILLYGILLTVRFAGGYNTPKERRFLIIMSIVIWIAQTLCWSFWGLKITAQLYPLITHLPIVLILVLILKKQPPPFISAINLILFVPKPCPGRLLWGKPSSIVIFPS